MGGGIPPAGGGGGAASPGSAASSNSGPNSNSSKKSSSRRNAWGNLSYADLITQAIQSSPEGRLTLSQVYEWMVHNIPYFKDKGDSNSSAGWKVRQVEHLTHARILGPARRTPGTISAQQTLETYLLVAMPVKVPLLIGLFV